MSNRKQIKPLDEAVISEIIRLRKQLGLTQAQASEIFLDFSLFNRIESPCFRGPEPKYDPRVSPHLTKRVIATLEGMLHNESAKVNKTVDYICENFEMHQPENECKAFHEMFMREIKSLGDSVNVPFDAEEMADYLLTVSEAIRENGL